MYKIRLTATMAVFAEVTVDSPDAEAAMKKAVEVARSKEFLWRPRWDTVGATVAVLLDVVPPLLPEAERKD